MLRAIFGSVSTSATAITDLLFVLSVRTREGCTCIEAGPPKLVPLVMGLPRPEMVERAKRGEVILGGCLVTGFEPKYYLIW